MRIAVIQHRLRATPSDDAAALADAAERAVADGADVVVLPEVPSLELDASVAGALAVRLRTLDAYCLQPPHAPRFAVGENAVSGAEHEGLLGRLGPLAVLVGDECMAPLRLAAVRADALSAVVLSPGSENDLQAESFLEFAIALSDSLTGLVIVAECVGAEQGGPGHGGSAIIVLGEVVAEALGDDDVIVAEVSAPVARPEPPEPMPEIPLLLRQRLAFHAGRKLEVSGYPADIT